MDRYKNRLKPMKTTTKPNRIKSSLNLTISPEIKDLANAMATIRGMKLSQLVEQLLREELVSAGALPAEASGKLRVKNQN